MKQRGRKSAAALATVPLETPEIPQRFGIEPPAHLTAEAAAWWRQVTADYELEPHHLKLLQSAAEAWDRQQQARRSLADYGALTFSDERGVIKAHPCVAIERDARVAFARLVRELDLDAGAPSERRPPALISNRRLNDAH